MIASSIPMILLAAISALILLRKPIHSVEEKRISRSSRADLDLLIKDEGKQFFDFLSQSKEIALLFPFYFSPFNCSTSIMLHYIVFWRIGIIK